MVQDIRYVGVLLLEPVRTNGAAGLAVIIELGAFLFQFRSGNINRVAEDRVIVYEFCVTQIG